MRLTCPLRRERAVLLLLGTGLDQVQAQVSIKGGLGVWKFFFFNLNAENALDKK